MARKALVELTESARSRCRQARAISRCLTVGIVVSSLGRGGRGSGQVLVGLAEIPGTQWRGYKLVRAAAARRPNPRSGQLYQRVSGDDGNGRVAGKLGQDEPGL